MAPVAGSRWPSTPLCCPVYQTPPSAAGATSWGWDPAGTSNSRTWSATGPTGASDEPVSVLGVGAIGDGPDVVASGVDGAPVAGTGLAAPGAHDTTSSAPIKSPKARGRRSHGGRTTD